MSDKKLSQYPNEVTLLPNDDDLMDVSVLISTGPDVYDSRKMKFSTLGLSDLLVAYKEGIDMTTTGEVDLDYNCTSKKIYVSRIVVEIESFAPQPETLAFELNIDSVANALSNEVILNPSDIPYVNGDIFTINTDGLLPVIDSDLNTINFNVTDEYGGGFMDANVYIYGRVKNN